MSLTEKPLLVTVLSTDERATVADTITAGDVAAYPLTITFSDLEELPALPRLRFVSGSQYWDRDTSDGVAVVGNAIEYTLESAFYAEPGLSLWVSFYDDYLFTPLQIAFSGIRVPTGNVQASTSETYPSWVSSAWMQLGDGSGSTANRPNNVHIGYMYFDITLGKPAWWNGTGWVDATGTTV